LIFYSASAHLNEHLVTLNFIGETLMSAKHTLENIARNTWLAGLGSIESSVEALGKSIDAAQEKTNNIYNELLTRGEEIQGKINDTKDDLEARGKKYIGTSSKESQEERLAKLNATVDHLTTVVVKLIEKHNAATPVKKAAAKSVPKTATKAKPPGTANKAVPESAAKSVPKTATKAKSAGTANKAAAKSAAKSVPKTATKAKPAGTANKAVPESAAKSVPKTATKAKSVGTANKAVAKSAAKSTSTAVTDAKPPEPANKVANPAITATSKKAP